MNKTLTYLFDPLCGWCYGATSGLATIAGIPGVTVELLPSGLFAGSGARTMDETFAAYAWANDQRIERLTGQIFSDRYRNEVLADRSQPFDSGAATVALTAVAMTTPQRELEALKVIQRARYVDGKNVTERETLAELLAHAEFPYAATRLARPDAALLNANRARIDRARALMQEFGAHGVPTFILHEGRHRRLLHASAVLSNAQAFARQLSAA